MMMVDISRGLIQTLCRYVMRFAHQRLCVVAALALLGWTGDWHWFPELFSHFLPQYATFAAFLCLLVFLGRSDRWRWAALGITLPIWVPTTCRF